MGNEYTTIELFLHKPHIENGKITHCDFLLLTGRNTGLLFRNVDLAKYSTPIADSNRHDIRLNQYLIKGVFIDNNHLTNNSNIHFSDIIIKEDFASLFIIKQKYASINQSIFDRLYATEKREDMQKKIWEEIDKQQ